MRIAILTVSDRASRGEREDVSGPALAGVAEAQGWQVVRRSVVADEVEAVSSTLRVWCDAGDVDVILTTGGTGFAPRDRTPEATLGVVERLAPGLAEAVRLSGLPSNRHAMLSRGVAGIRGSTLILNLPGSPGGAREGLEAVLAVLPHAVDLMQGSPSAEAGHRPPPGIRRV